MFQIMLVIMSLVWLTYGGDKFESSYATSRKWVLGPNWFKRGISKGKNDHAIT